MSSKPLSGALPPLTLAELMRRISEDPTLSARRRQDLSSAVRRCATLLDRNPAQVPADPTLLRARLGEIAPAAHGLSRQSWNNLRSLLRAALALLGPIAPGRHLGTFTPEWQSLMDAIPKLSQRRILSRFMRHCSAAGIAPAAVDDAVMDAFGTALEQSLVRFAAIRSRDTRSSWNRACREVPGWPGRPVTAVSRVPSYVLPWSALPSSLQTDATAWLDRLAGRDPLEELPFRPVTQTTVQVRDRQIRAFASALVHRGRDPGSLRSLGDLVEITALKEGLRFFLERRGGQSSSAIADLAATLKAIARHWVKVPPEQLDQISAIQRRLDVRTRGLTATNRDRLRPFEARENVAGLLGLPANLAAQAERLPAHRRQQAALLVQTAVAIEVLLMAPIRVGNLAALDIDRHLIRPGRRGGAMHIVIPSAEVKNREDLEYPLPPATVVLIERYLDEHHRVLAATGSRALFPGRDLRSKGRAALGKQISKTVFRATGLTVHPHLFRHIAGKLYLGANPGAIEVVRRVLGHRSIETTLGYYTGAETAAAVRHFDATLLKLRESSETNPGRRRSPKGSKR